LFFFRGKHSRIFVQPENLKNDGVPALSNDRKDKPIEQLTVEVKKGTPVDSIPQPVVFNKPVPEMLEQVSAFKGITCDQNILETQGETIISPLHKFSKGTVSVPLEESPDFIRKTKSIPATNES
jgi:hypothetical protein